MSRTCLAHVPYLIRSGTSGGRYGTCGNKVKLGTSFLFRKTGTTEPLPLSSVTVSVMYDTGLKGRHDRNGGKLIEVEIDC